MTKLTKAKVCFEQVLPVPGAKPHTALGEVWLSLDIDMSHGIFAYFDKPDAEPWEAIYVPFSRVYWFRLLERPDGH